MNKKITISTIAKKTGFSPSTVSRALNRHPSIPKNTAEIIRLESDSLGYRITRPKKTAAIVLTSGDLFFGWYPFGIFDAVRREAFQRGWKFVTIGSNDLDILREKAVSGILSLDYDPSVEKICEKFNIPLVCVNSKPRHIDGVYEVRSDAIRATAEAIGCFYHNGHRRIGLVELGNPRKFLQNAFSEICASFGIETGDCRTIMTCAQVCRELRYPAGNAIRMILEKKLTAVLLTGTAAGPVFLDGARTAGLRIPRDLSIIAWETPNVSGYLTPPLTTFAHDYARLAEKGFEMLETFLHRGRISEDTLVPMIYNERASVTVPNLKRKI